MKFLIAILAVTFSVGANAGEKSKKLVCQTGNSGDIDISIELLQDKREKLTVTLSSMNDEAKPVVYVNSHFINGGLLKNLKTGEKINAIVSVSDLEEANGGAYQNAGVIEIFYNNATQVYDVTLAAQNNVYLAACKISE